MTDTARDERDADIRYEAAHHSFELAKDRYVQSVLAEEIGTRYAAFVEKRGQLSVRLERARSDYDGADAKLAAAVRAYGRRLPHRVEDLGVQRPSLLERFAGGRTYANVVATAERRSEVRRTVDQYVAELDELVRTIDAILEARGRVVRRGLQSSAGFAKAVRRDPLLENGYTRLVAAMDDRKKRAIGLDDLGAFYAERTGT